MNFTLNTLDKNGTPLDVGNIIVASGTILVSNGNPGDSIVGITTIKAGNQYTLRFIAGGGSVITPTSDIEVSFFEDPTITTDALEDQQNGVTDYVFTPAADISQIDFAHNTGIVDIFDGTVEILGEDITITIDGNVTTGVNTATETVADDDTIDISVVSAGFHPYTNTVRVYDYDLNVSIKLIPIVTDANDPEFRKPYPFFFEILEPCSYNIHVYNAQSAPFGMISYYHTEDTDNTFATTPNGVLDTCVPESMSITQRIVVRAIANCGGTSPIIFDETFTINPITTTEFTPYVVLARPLNCCETIDAEIAINPQEIELYNTGIHACDITTIDPVLVYTMIAPDGTTTVLASYNGTEVDAGPLTSLGFTYTPTALGSYTLQIAVTNCCVTTTTTTVFDVCNSWVVTNKDCNIIKIVNLSTTETISYTLKELNDFDAFDVVTISEEAQLNIDVLPSTEVEVDLQIDNLYTITVVDNLPSTTDREEIFVLDCNIKKCKKELLRNYLCGEDECDIETRHENMYKLTEFVTLEKIIYQKWDEWKQQQSIDNTFSINDIMEDVITLSKAIESITKLCAKCGIINSCSTDKRYTCNYTISNGGYYIVPLRSASIIVPNNGTDCGCN